MMARLAGLVLLGGIASCLGCSPGLTPAEQGQLEAHASTLEHCRAVGRDAGSYAAYEACEKEAGIK